MKISRIKLHHFRCFDYVDIVLHDLNHRILDQVIFTGRNGGGKSSVLDAINLAFRLLNGTEIKTSKNWIAKDHNEARILVEVAHEGVTHKLESLIRHKDGKEYIKRVNEVDKEFEQELLNNFCFTAFMDCSSNIERTESIQKEVLNTIEFLTSSPNAEKSQLDSTYPRLWQWAENLYSSSNRSIHILLIDDFGAGIHPVTQRTLLLKLSALLPETQIILSSTQPQIIQQAKRDEVFTLMPHNDEEYQVRQFNKDPREMTIDEILISSIFQIESYESVALEKLRNNLRPSIAQVDEALDYSVMLTQDLLLSEKTNEQFKQKKEGIRTRIEKGLRSLRNKS